MKKLLLALFLCGCAGSRSLPDEEPYRICVLHKPNYLKCYGMTLPSEPETNFRTSDDRVMGSTCFPPEEWSKRLQYVNDLEEKVKSK